MREFERVSLNPDHHPIADAFAQSYYTYFDVEDEETRKKGLSDFYDPENSFLTFEGSQFQGKDGILEKLATLPFGKVERTTISLDSQPLPDGSIYFLVFGKVKIDDDPVHHYSHVFILRKREEGGFFIGNETFRLHVDDS